MNFASRPLPPQLSSSSSQPAAGFKFKPAGHAAAAGPAQSLSACRGHESADSDPRRPGFASGSEKYHELHLGRHDAEDRLRRPPPGGEKKIVTQAEDAGTLTTGPAAKNITDYTWAMASTRKMIPRNQHFFALTLTAYFSCTFSFSLYGPSKYGISGLSGSGMSRGSPGTCGKVRRQLLSVPWDQKYSDFGAV